jgi:hypothetical protein
MQRRLACLVAILIAAPVVILAPAVQAQVIGPNLAPAPAMPMTPETLPGVVQVPQQKVDDRIAFNSAERWIIPTYFNRVREKQKRASRSKKYERLLPDGITAYPAKGDLLPLGLVAGLDRLPGPLVRDLPPNRPNTDRVVVGKDVLMVSTATGEVLDILSNVLY